MADTAVFFEGINGSFHKYPLLVKSLPLIRTSCDTGIEAQIFVRIGVDAFAVIRGIGAGMFTAANPLCSSPDGFVTNPFKVQRAFFTAGFPKIIP
jgi:hypothetical protein